MPSKRRRGNDAISIFLSCRTIIVSIVTYCSSAYKSKPCLYILVQYIVEREEYSDLALPLSTAAHTAIGAR